MGISNQFRVLGGSIGVAICANILNNHITSRLSGILTSDQMKALLASAQAMAFIPPELQEDVRDAFPTNAGNARIERRRTADNFPNDRKAFQH